MDNLVQQVQCTDGRSTLSQMLRDGSLRVYTEGNTLYGSWNSDTQEIYINWTKHLSTGALDTVELVDTMVHEAVHKLLGHIRAVCARVRSPLPGSMSNVRWRIRVKTPE